MVTKSSLRIAVDMTPVLSNGENGGSKVLVLTLFKQLQTLASQYKFFLLTAPWNHAELLEYQTENTQCILIDSLVPADPPPPPISDRRVVRLAHKVTRKIKGKLKQFYPEKSLLKKHRVDLLFCPFSAPNFAEKDIPTVAIVYDLQHLDYPDFFTDEERQHRDQFLNNLLQVAQKLICISEFSRQSFLTKLNAPAEKLAVTYISVHDRWPGLDPATVTKNLQELGLSDRSYAFYPANYWPHKNHRMLLTAYEIYQNNFPGNTLNLVFTGALKQEEQKLQEMVAEAGLSDRVHFLGYLSEAHLESVWRGCHVLVFPSLYEGFGIPVLEGMIFGKPVLSSTAGSLPEVGGNAVIYFDPKDPEELANCLSQIDRNETAATDLIQKGYERLKQFESEKMVQEYLKVFLEVVRK
ncbi:MAG: glycosyltransferase family 4 protein [Leptolyngbyaceae cyanobacterium SU_3_3]|nr:glycosyltransferase family 4 protein [Leptolyngbyaceae cyanobacterium SU_3_3]